MKSTINNTNNQVKVMSSIAFKSAQVKAYNATHGTKLKFKELPTDTQDSIAKAYAQYVANCNKPADSKQTDSKQKQTAEQKQKQNKADSKQKQTDKKEDKEAKQKQTAEQKQKQIDSITNNIDVTMNADKHYIAKANKYLVKFQVSAKEVKIRCNKAYAEATKYATELHANWNVKYAIINATVEQIITEFKKLTAEADKKQKEAK